MHFVTWRCRRTGGRRDARLDQFLPAPRFVRVAMRETATTGTGVVMMVRFVRHPPLGCSTPPSAIAFWIDTPTSRTRYKYQDSHRQSTTEGSNHISGAAAGIYESSMERIHVVEGYQAGVDRDLETADHSLSSSPTDALVIEEGRLSTSRSPNQLGHWQILLMGQGIALVAASANACSFALIYNLKVDLPISELFLLYLTLALLHVRPLLSRNRNTKGELSSAIGVHLLQPGAAAKHTVFGTRIKLHVSWWVYALVALLDVLANLSTLLSYRYTSLMSTSLLGSLTIPSVMLVSRVFMGRVFSSHHFIGVALCMLGGTMTVWLDTSNSSNMDSNSRTGDSFLGDALAIAAALLYGIGDCLAEYSIKHMDRVEYLFMIGLYGFVFTGLMIPLMEGQKLGHLLLKTHLLLQLKALVGIVVYVSGVVLFYISATLFLVHGDATMLVLSLQATQFWAILFSVLAEHHPPTPWFFIAVILVVSGVIHYETSGALPAAAATVSCGRIDMVGDEADTEQTTLMRSREDCTKNEVT